MGFLKCPNLYFRHFLGGAGFTPKGGINSLLPLLLVGGGGVGGKGGHINPLLFALLGGKAGSSCKIS